MGPKTRSSSESVASRGSHSSLNLSPDEVLAVLGSFVCGSWALTPQGAPGLREPVGWAARSRLGLQGKGLCLCRAVGKWRQLTLQWAQSQENMECHKTAFICFRRAGEGSTP